MYNNNDYTDMHCFRGDHEIARLVNNVRHEAHVKHGPNSIEAIDAHDPRWLTILVEEVGELAHELTYDANSSDERLAAELIDVITVATAWLDRL